MSTELVVNSERSEFALQTAIALWADATTDVTSNRRRDLLRDKRAILVDFFGHIAKAPGLVTPVDVKRWQAILEQRGLTAGTVYGRLARVSSFYQWARSDPALGAAIATNPVELARPKAPKAYQSPRTQALTDDQLRALVDVVNARADAGNVVAKRDYALLLFFLLTGMRRAEVIRLTWGDVQLGTVMTITGLVKGGDYVSREVRDSRVAAALVEYLVASDRRSTLTAESPLWTRHDFAKPETDDDEPLTSHAFAHNLKVYAAAAGIGDIHVHQTRHSFARLVADQTGSMTDVQDALGHKNLATTRVYIRRVAVKRDRHSVAIGDRLGIGWRGGHSL
jgi:integrase